LVAAAAAVAGMTGAFAAKILAGTVYSAGVVTLAGPGEPLGAFLAAFAALEVGNLVSGKTKLDILVTPIVTITTGAIVGLLLGPPISALMTALGQLINWGVIQQPFL
ncbi:MAG: PTS sugar transporter subunit IIC, partial [Clostridiales bacterium]